MNQDSGIRVASASRRGTRDYNADTAVIHRDTALGRVAAAVIDGIGNDEHVVALSRVAAAVAARVSAHRGVLAGLLAAAETAAGDELADAVGVTALVDWDGYTSIAWTGDCRGYGWDGTRLRCGTTDHTVGQQLRVNGAPLELAEDHDNWIRTSLGQAVVATVYVVQIHDPLVILTSDGVHDSLTPAQFAELVREHQHDPQALADAVVNAVQDQDDGYRDDATIIVLAKA